VTAQPYAPVRTFRMLRRAWLAGTIVLSAGAFVLVLGDLWIADVCS
jgi:hypothetical protein